MRKIAIIEDDPIVGESLVQRLALEGYDAVWWTTGAAALEGLRTADADVIVCDIRLPDMNGEDLYRRALPSIGKRPIIFVTAFGEIDQAVRLVRLGADDYLTKPYSMDLLLEKIAALSEAAQATLEATAALGKSPAMQRIEVVLRRVRNIESTVLLTGETGVGKEVSARFLHDISERRERPFVAVNCAALPPELIDSAIFGHEKGAFTGAHGTHAGFAEQAGEGTLFLDEIPELPTSAQAKLLRLVQERSYQRVGGTRNLAFSARLVVATNANLPARIAVGSFREDLYYRLNVIELYIPPLRERREEIVPLLRQYLEHYAQLLGRRIREIDPLVESAALAHSWPGNIRELRNRLERGVALCEGEVLSLRDLFPEWTMERDGTGRLASLAEARASAEREHIRAALKQSGGQLGATAALLGISRTTLWEKMRRLGIASD